MGDSNTDPFDWSVDRVVFEFCHNPQPAWASNYNAPHVSNSGALEKALREHDIYGEPLLVHGNHEILKHELGIKSYGERYFIMKGIECLRNLSPKYHLHQRDQAANFYRATPTPHGGFISPQITNSNLSVHPFLPYPGHNGELQSSHASPSKRSIPELLPSFETPQTRPQAYLQKTAAPTNAAQVNGTMMLQQPIPQTEMRINHQEETTPPEPVVALGARDRGALDDASGAVGRCSPEKQPTGVATSAEIPSKLANGGADVMEPLRSTDPAKYTIVNGRKRLAPTFVSHLTKSSVVTPVASGTKSGSQYYLGQDGLGPENVFFLDFTSEDDNEEFDHVQHARSKGSSLYVARLIKHYYQQPIIQIPESKARARIPYSGALLKPGDPHYFTMFVPDLEPAMHNLLHWPALTAQSRPKRHRRNPVISLAAPNDPDAFDDTNETQYNSDDYDYLLEKYPPKGEDEDVLTLYGDSGDEGEYDLETWNEIDQDKREDDLEKNTGAMSQADVEAAINEGIKQIIANWHKTKLGRVQLKGYRLWTRANHEQRRQLEMDNALYCVHRCDQMIKRMRDTITKDVWAKASEVRHQCKIFDEAVAQREENQYFVTILSSHEAPIRPDIEVLKRGDRPPRADVPDGEEVLESDSDLADFILSDDSSDAGSIPHDGADFADAMEFLESGEPVRASRESVEVPPDAEASPLPPAGGETFEPSVEQSGERESVLAVGLESDGFQEQADLSDDSEGDIISPARKAGMSRRCPETPTTGTQKQAPESSRGSNGVGGSGDSGQDSDLDTTLPLPKSKYRESGRTALTPVDLTRSSSPSAATPIEESHGESSSEYQVQTPELNPIPITPITKKLKLSPPKALSTPHTTPSPTRTTIKIGQPSLPTLDDIPGIKGVDWKFLEERRDHERILAKVIYGLKRSEARKIQAHVQKLSEATLNDQYTGAHVSEGKFLDQIRNALLAIDSGNDVIEEVSSRQHNVQKIVRQLALIYASYANYTNLMDEDSHTKPLLEHAFAELHPMIKSFFDRLVLVLGYFCNSAESKPHGKKRKASNDDDEYNDRIEHEVDVLKPDIGDDHEASAEGEEPAGPSSIKKRKRKVLQSEEALSQQRSDQLRIQEEQRRKALADMKYAGMGLSGDDPAGHVIGVGEPRIFLHEHIGKLVKPHQVTGIQFMWREIVANPKHQGCLLAHTMGLGKTMQVISLLVTIALSAESDDVRIRDQVPEHLRKTKALILCPPSLIDNWHDELIMWRPDAKVLGKFYKIQSQKRLVRLQQMTQWAEGGGVLIISYEMFRGLISNDGKKLSEEEHAQVDRDLLKSPTIVVADEAHKMKNAGAKITQVASRFATTSRIALTGSPLANNLEEYHTMIDWVATGYLGNVVQFKAKFSEPISYGLYEDSTPAEKKSSLSKLITLGRTLEPKLNRADISAIKKEMPSKTEFFITLPLTSLQIKAYNIYAQALLKESSGNGPSNTRLWQWLHVLGLLCNHPLPFVNKLDERRYSREQKAKPRQTKAMAGTDESQGEALPTDVVLADIGLTPDMIEQALGPFRKLDEEGRLEDPSLSHRTLIVKQIVEESIKIGDKVLIFSHTIPTLNYLEKMVDDIEGCNPCRIDGETKMSSRQDATKVFNKKDSAFNVFLISMKAGGLGLNLQGANRVIIYDFGFNPTWEDQAIGRAYRLGQTRSVYVYRFRAGGTFEDVTYNKAVFKTNLFSRVVDKKNYMSQAKKSLSSYLFEVKEVEQHDLEDSLGRDSKVLDRIVRQAKYIRNIELTETFQKEDLEKLSDEEVQLALEEYEDQQMQRDDPAAYAQKQAAKLAQQMQTLITDPAVRPPTAATAPFPSNPSNVAMPTLSHTIGSALRQGMLVANQESPYFSPRQAEVFGHRAPTAPYPPHPFRPELVANPMTIHNAPQQPPRVSSAGLEEVAQMDGSNDEPDPQPPPAKSKDQDVVDQQCKPQ